MDRDLIGQLATTTLFQDLNGEELEEILSGVRRVQLEDGAPLLEQGDPPNGAFMLLDGRVQVLTKLPGGGETLIAEAGPGSLVGELGLIRSGNRSATVRAAGRVEAAFAERRYFIASLLQLRPAAIKVLRRLALILTERLRVAHGRVRDHVESDGQGTYYWPIPLPDSDVGRESDFDVRAFLPILPCFKEWSREDIDAVFAEATVEQAVRGQMLVQSGTEPERAYLIVRGAVASGFVRDDRIHQLNVLGPGQFCLIGPVLEARAASVCYVVRESATLLGFDRAAVEKLASAGDQATLRFLGAVNEHQATMISRAGNHLTRLVGLSRLYRQYDNGAGTAV